MTRTPAALALAVLVGALPGAASAAAAAGLVCPPPAEAPGPAGFQVWLDRDVASTAAPPGATVEAGFTLWDPRQRELLGVSGLEACLNPAPAAAPRQPGAAPGEFTLRGAVRGDDGVDRAIEGSDVVLRVGGAAVSGSSQTIPGSSPSAAAQSGTTGDPGIPAIAWILGVGAFEPASSPGEPSATSDVSATAASVDPRRRLASTAPRPR